eukprot:TRINITY_DN6_c0_g1_i1.p1 TRINITY_DN6_c0_g1~~TRINITY_DN6_c0_g1_i1.p1  ORF type:complete len:216 (+),score=50.86 TRINITY_DN6_c0_g1_i1:43-690(+)
MPSRNPELVKGVRRYGRYQAYSKYGRYRVKKEVAPTTDNTVTTKTFGKGTREVVRPRQSKFYPGDDVRTKLYSRKNRQSPKVRASLQPGTVLILLAGKFKGKRVVLLKTLPSGLLVVTGPYVVNGVPLRRVNPAYVIATSTSISLEGYTVDKQVKDALFARPATADEGVTEERKALQQSVDEELLKRVNAVEGLRAYLGAKFSLSKHQYPHELKF